MNILKKGASGRHLLAALLLFGLSMSARAEMVTEKLFESTTLVTGTSLNLTELALSSAGTLIVELTDMKWPDLLGTLSFSLAEAGHVLEAHAMNGAEHAVWNIDIQDPTTLYAAVFAKPAAAIQAGMYNVKISYQSLPPVPLPAAAWFLISGLAGLVAFRPKQKLSQNCA